MVRLQRSGRVSGGNFPEALKFSKEIVVKRKPLVVLALVLLLAGVVTSLPQPATSAKAGPNSRPGAPVGISALPTLFIEAYAIVNANGTCDRGSSDLVSCAKVSGFDGSYDVEFDDNVTDCAYIATIGLPGSVGGNEETPGQITTARRNISVNGVFVATWNQAGNVRSDRAFHLALQCF